LRTVNSQSTRYNPQSGTENLLDLLIKAVDDSVLHSVVTGVTFSDHRSVIGEMRLNRQPAPVVSFRHRDPKNINLDAFRQHLASLSLVTAPSDDPDVCMDTFLSDVGAALGKEAPMRNFSRRSESRGQPMASEAADAKREFRRVERQFIRLRTRAS